jgi:hypothetical protein
LKNLFFGDIGFAVPNHLTRQTAQVASTAMPIQNSQVTQSHSAIGLAAQTLPLGLQHVAHGLVESLSAFVHPKGLRGFDETLGLRRIVRPALAPSLLSLS